MTLIWMDGFDDYGTGSNIAGTLTSGGYASANTIGVTADTPTGTGYAITTKDDSANMVSQVALRRALGGNYVDVIAGFHVKVDNRETYRIMSFEYENGLGDFTTQALLLMNGQGGLTLTNSSRSIAYAVSEPNVFLPNVWYFLEVRLDIPNNLFVVRVNEEIVMTAEYIPPAPVTNIFRLFGKDYSTYSYRRFDNLYLIDADSGLAPFNDFLGEVAVGTGKPVSDAGPNDFAVTGTGPGHYGQVDDPTLNDADFLSSETVGHEELFNMEDVPADTLEVLAVGLVYRVRKEAGGSGYIRGVAQVDGDTLLLPDRNPTSVFANQLEIMERQPNGGAWTIAAADALKLGVEIISD